MSRSNLASLMDELGLESFAELHRFSVSDRERFWSLVLGRLGIVFRRKPDSIVDVSRGVRDPAWLSGALFNIVESCFGFDPSATAIVYGKENGELETTSYGNLAAGIRRFASGLRRHGFRPGDAIALYLPMTPECVVAYLGTIWAGCRVVSIAESFSAEELRKRILIGGARAVVTVSSYRRAGRVIALYPKVREAFEGLEGEPRAIVLQGETLEGQDLAWENLLSPDGESEAHIALPDEVTNVLFSSGTTGTPKAIPWTHTTPLKCGMDAHFHQDVHREDVVSWPTSIGWMMGPWLIYACLLNRATMALHGGAPTEPAFAKFVREARVSILGVVPSLVRTWRSQGSVSEEDFGSVRLFSSTGEASTEDDYHWLMGRAGFRAPVIEYLGGTEIGGGHITSTILHPCVPSTFSTPALGVDFVVLDEEGRPVPEGETGELFLVPPALGMSQRLLNASHDEVYYERCPQGPLGEVLRRHGDRIEVLPGGGYKAQGRADDTMNLGGIKVGSLELERLVNEHSAVLESVAVGIAPKEGGPEKLIVHVVLREPIEPGRLKREPAWSTPALYRGEGGAELVTNGANWIRANDPRTGEELWRLSHGDLQVITPTPLVAGERIVVTGGNPTGAQTTFAIRPGARGDAQDHVLWTAERSSPYTPTPVAYDGILYVIVDNGILSAYDLATGERLYRTRLEVGAGFSASPVVSDGRIYLPSEDGAVFVVGAGRVFRSLARNEMGEPLMASPAVSDGTLFVRGSRHLFAIRAR